MFIIYSIFIGAMIGYIGGGRLKNIINYKIHGSIFAFAALFIQIFLFTNNPLISFIPMKLTVILHILSYLLLACFLVVNRRIPGILIIAAGTLLNFIAIILNGGYMPAMSLGTGAAYSTASNIDNNIVKISHDTLLPFLGDVIHIPDLVPFSSYISIGDFIIALGTGVFFVLSMKPHHESGEKSKISAKNI